MKIATLLPHVEVFGGVRRYIEMGNALVRRGHCFVLLTPEGKKPDWLEFRGEVKAFEAIPSEKFEIGICSEYSIRPQFDRLRAVAKFFYFVLEGHKKEKGVARRNYHFLGSSEGICRRIERKHKVGCIRVPGGKNPDIFYRLPRSQAPGPVFEKQDGTQPATGQPLQGREFRILCYGRIYKKRKGVRMACGLPVVCTPSGSRDFAAHNETALVVPFAHPILLRRQIRRLIKDPELRERLAEAGYRKISEFTWDALAERLEAIFRGVLAGGARALVTDPVGFLLN